MPPIITMKQSTIDLLGVEQVHATYAGGQKYVFISTCRGVKCAVKMFKYGFGERERRELQFYKDNAHNEGIPNILSVHDHDGETIVIEEFIEGQSLLDIASRYAGDHVVITKLICEIADIMEPIWREGKVHRDLKPPNIIIKPNGSPIVLDFGIFKDPDQTTITDTGFQPHSWDFGAPEQLQAKKEHITYRTDFFSLGVIAYYLYFSRRPFGNSREEVITTFTGDPLSYVVADECPLKPLFASVFRVDPSGRPRNVRVFKEKLGI